MISVRNDNELFLLGQWYLFDRKITEADQGKITQICLSKVAILMTVEPILFFGAFFLYLKGIIDLITVAVTVVCISIVFLISIFILKKQITSYVLSNYPCHLKR